MANLNSHFVTHSQELFSIFRKNCTNVGNWNSFRCRKIGKMSEQVLFLTPRGSSTRSKSYAAITKGKQVGPQPLLHSLLRCSAITFAYKQRNSPLFLIMNLFKIKGSRIIDSGERDGERDSKKDDRMILDFLKLCSFSWCQPKKRMISILN